MTGRDDPTVMRTPALGCAACREFRLHTLYETREFHPLSGHGYNPQQGWTHSDLALEATRKSQKAI